jgi:transposase
MDAAEIITTGLMSQPFLMISLFCFLQMMRFNIDPFTFSSPDMIPLMNLFLHGKIISLRYTDTNQQPRLVQLVRQMNGVVCDGPEADYIISSKPICISSTARIVFPAWLEALFVGKEFLSPQPYQLIGNKKIPGRTAKPKPEDIDKEIALCLGDHVSWLVIAERFHVSMRRISKINKKMASGETTLEHRPPGKPSKMTSEVISRVRDLTMQDPFLGSRHLASEIAQKLGISICAQTINSIRKMLRFKYQLPHRSPLITEKQEQKRMDFCMKSLAGNIDWAAEVIISDESRFGLFDDSRRMWIQRGVYTDLTMRATPKHDASFMVWGAIGRNFKSKLVFIEGNLNADGYQQMLTENGILVDMRNHFGESPGYFQQDGAPAHRAKKTMTFLQKEINTIPDWPPNSPDLSVIENVWGILKARIARRGPKTIPELKAILQEEWNNLDQAMLDELIASMPWRFRMCIEEHGKSISRHVRNLHPFAIPTGPNLPPGFMRIHDLSLVCVGRTIHIAARVRETHASESQDDIHWVALEDHKSLTPPGKPPGRIGMLVFGDDIGAFANGTTVVIIARVLAAHASLSHHGTLGQRSSLSLQIYLSFDGHDLDHELEIADSDSEESASGVS